MICRGDPALLLDFDVNLPSTIYYLYNLLLFFYRKNKKYSKIISTVQR